MNIVDEEDVLKKPKTTAEKRAERQADRGRGRWVFKPLRVNMGGIQFEVDSRGQVYERVMVRPRVRPRFDGAKPEDNALVPGPLARVNDFARAEAVREAVRAEYQRRKEAGEDVNGRTTWNLGIASTAAVGKEAP